ncbi:NAD(P)-dependent oxidoreductase [Microlunatus sp. Gsoil 973]|uniref:NAD(P)-dependent oxidoreductase n=1 Tax=Microlunatus sp. Gsoil 973 TaxID=2672569 RepID=UPI0012B4D192|nr:NAD(P)-dependent oxidoreductase [Microlunatus sp. Gsoil 973]QGN34274.1 NAD-binding protein [Microlunatus sp. Gsoil 973]
MTVPVTRATPVGFVGLGNLGQPMALNLIDHGWSLQVVDSKPERVEPVVAAGATAVGDVTALAETPVVCFAVPDDRGIRSVLADGLSQRLGPDHLIIVHSTTLPNRARELAAEIKRATGAAYLEVPVSGGSDRARRGELSAFIGGDDPSIEAALAVLEDEASKLFRLGPVGAGSATKLANQLIAFSALAGVHEALQLTAAFQVAEEAALDAIASATGDTWVGRNLDFWDRTALDYNAAGVPEADRPWAKDLVEVLTTAADLGIELPVATLLSEVLPPAVEDRALSIAERAGA